MKFKSTVFVVLAMAALPAMAQYAPVGDRIKTVWAEKIDVTSVWNEYPRPIMERNDWINLNGIWSYAIVNKSAASPQESDGEILVPFAVESSLSGVGRSLTDEQALWYKRTFSLPPTWKNKRVLLHFGAVDWQADVWVNGIKVGMHTGGFTPFEFDITEALKNGENTLEVRVLDATDKGWQPRGKQVIEPREIWYTPVSGIWQTVWLEPVADTYITNLRILPDIDANTLTIDIGKSECDPNIIAEVKVLDGGQIVALGKGMNNQPIEVQMPEDVKLWSPDNPFLYNVEISITRNGKVLDSVKSYAAMRKYSMAKDKDGILRFQLNNKFLFHFGMLDQGWWPDGLYTAPSHEAMVYDIDKQKEWGYNMIRKHIKVEPATWYAHCDRVGMIVWQDMPSGEMCCPWQNRNYFEGEEFVRSAESEANYRKEWKEIMDCLYSYPCIGVWIPFNEAWGQFKTVEISEWTKQYDSSRLVNSASGGNFFHVGDILDLHNYPHPEMYLFDSYRANVLGEYGGIGYPLKGHLWAPDRNWGYVQYNSVKEVTDEYVNFGKQLLKLIKRGFTGAVYTQTTDVEIEVNGILTYDRKAIKMEEDRLKEINMQISHSLDYLNE